MDEQFKEFINICTTTFENYEHDISNVKKPSVWHFTAESNFNEKKYAIFCVTALKKVRSLIRVAMNQKNKDTRLVVVCIEHDEDDYIHSKETDYALLSIKDIADFNDEMTMAKYREGIDADDHSYFSTRSGEQSTNHGQVIIKQ